MTESALTLEQAAESVAPTRSESPMLRYPLTAIGDSTVRVLLAYSVEKPTFPVPTNSPANEHATDGDAKTKHSHPAFYRH